MSIATDLVHDQAQAALRATPTRNLLRKVEQITHQMHAVGKGQDTDLRAMRTMIEDEIVRRTGEA